MLAEGLIMISLFVLLLIIVISTLPLYFTVKLLGGKTTILKTLLVMVVLGLLSIVINLLFSDLATLIFFLLMVWIFHEVFRLKWLKAFFVWIIWFIFVLIFGFIATLFGISILIFSLL